MDYVNHFPQDLVIKDIIRETALCKTFLLGPAIGEIRFQAGQYITFRADVKDPTVTRSYSISSTPLENKLAITIKRQENGLFSRMMIDRAQVGDKVKAIGVFGKYVLPPAINAEDHFFFFAAGSGIVPVYSLVKTLLATGRNKIILIYSSRSEEETIFYEQLQALQHQYKDRLQITYFFSTSKNVQNARVNAFLIPELLREKVDQLLEKTYFYICGPIDYMDIIRMTLLTHGVSRQRIYTEEFFIYTQEDREEELTPPADQSAHTVQININNHTYHLTVQYPDSILKTALDHNLFLPYSCSSGQCGSCAAKLTSGKVWMSYNAVLTDKDIANGWILTCQGFPVEGDAAISFDEKY